MICPFCQHELDVATMGCPRCGAAYRHRPGMTLRLKLRTLGIGGLMLLASTYFLTSCVFTYIDSDTVVDACTQFSNGGNCEITTLGRQISPQSSQFGGPNMKDAQVQQLLSMWNQGQQPTQNNTMITPGKTPAR